MKEQQKESWGAKEFDDIEFGDKRLNARLVSICDRFSDSPESSINQACEDWAETKAAYRFFQNEKIEAEKIMASHQNKTRIRAQKYKTVLAIQDTSYFIYTHHPKTEGLNRLNITRQKNSKLYSDGLLMHTCLGVTTEGLPIGLFDQKLVQRDADFKKKGAKRYDVIPIEEKESYKWLETLRETEKISQDTQIVTVCDREADLYDFFHLSDQLTAQVLVRAISTEPVIEK